MITTEQIISLAPDDASAKAGRGLAVSSKWQNVGFDDAAIWGECQGSGKNTYQTAIDLSSTVFKCSCPSRKFPCKHGIGLYLLYANNQLKSATQPQFCVEWLAKRAETATRKTETHASPETAAKREQAKIKRSYERESKVADGLRELETWLKDLVRQGLATAQTQPVAFWEKMAKRLIDAQCPNAARLVREMSSDVHQKNEENWVEVLLENVGKIYLICEGYKRIDDLPPPIQADVKTAIGFTVKEEDLNDAETVTDVWQILGKRAFEQDKLRVQRTWLRGETSKRDALILDFAFQNQSFDATLIVGAKIRAELAFYLSNFPLRAIIKRNHEIVIENQSSETVDKSDFARFTKHYAQSLARNVWIETFPANLKNVSPKKVENNLFLCDENGAALLVNSSFANVWQLIAICGGESANVFAEWNGKTLSPLTIFANDKTIQF